MQPPFDSERPGDPAPSEDDALDDETAPSGAAPPGPVSIDRYLPVLAIGAMIATFVVVPPSFAMTMIAAIWLAGTRLSRSRRLLGLTLTEALAWVATITIVEFVSILILYFLGGQRAA